jgi:hypothetical protein
MLARGLNAMMSRRFLWWAAAPVILLLVVSAWFAAAFRPSRLKAAAEEELAKRLNLDASIGELRVSLLPTPRAHGTGLRLNIPDRPDLPPFISIERFSVAIGPLSLARRQVRLVEAQGLVIAVPPGGDRGGLPRLDFDSRGEGGLSKVMVKTLVAENAELRFVPREPDDTPLVFAIHSLTMSDVGAGLAMGYDATLTNPIPRGVVQSTGRIGPWMTGDVGATPVEGEYVFADADMSTINGLGGTLRSTGAFAGDLRAIRVRGEASIPQFSLDLGGTPVPLTTAFETVVDGTDGTVVLERVDATLIETRMLVSGAITNMSGPGNHQVDLEVRIEDGRIEDLLALAIESAEPIMTGDVSLETTFSLPPGPARVRDRVRLSGRFGLSETRFTDADVQRKLQELSRRSQGRSADDPIGRVLTDLAGQFAIASGRVALTNLTFRVPGARVAMGGHYALTTGALDFRGTLRMDASVSSAVGGFKSIFIKPFDSLFRREGAGAVLPIRIQGTRMQPKFGLEMGKILR